MDLQLKCKLKAEEYFRFGRVEDCAELLKSALSERTLFSRAQWRTAANLLACKMKIALGCNDTDQLVQVHRMYTSLWEQIVSLPLAANSLLTEMTVTFALCQLEHIIVPAGRLVSSSANSCVISHCQRLCEYASVEWVGLSESLHTLIKTLEENTRELFLKIVYLVAVCKMRCSHTLSEGLSLMASLHSIVRQSDEGEEVSGIELALRVKSLLNADNGEHQYLQAWRHYNVGEYGTALSMLRSVPSSPISSLLRGHCLARMGKSQSALCCYLACLNSNNKVASLTAMASCCLLYRQTSNSQAELEARTLRQQALRNETRCVSEGVMWWRGEELRDDPIQLSDTQWAESAYITAVRALHYNKFEIVTTVLKELLECGHLPPSLPPSSLLHLLLAKALFLSGDLSQAQAVCDKLVNHLSILELEECAPHSLLRLTQSLLLEALALAEMGDRDRAKCISHKSYQACGFLISRLCKETESTTDKELQQVAITLMELSLTLMGILSVRGGEKDKALSLLTQAACLPSEPTVLTVHNYCLLLTQLGKLKEAANCWLKRRGLSPSSKDDYDRLDVALLKVWIRQN